MKVTVLPRVVYCVVRWDKFIAERFHIKEHFSGVFTSLKPWSNFALFVCFLIHASILGAFAKLLKATISCVMSVCLSPSVGARGTWLPLNGISWNWICEYFSKICRKTQIPLKSDKNIEYLIFMDPCLVDDSVEIPARCSFVIEFIIPKFIEGSTCFERHTAHHQELWTVFAASGLYTAIR